MCIEILEQLRRAASDVKGLLLLQVKSLEPIMGPTSIESILSRAMEPPDKRTIAIGVKMLQSIGALDREENLTPLGECPKFF